jgi:hypothetical protein
MDGTNWSHSRAQSVLHAHARDTRDRGLPIDVACGAVDERWPWRNFAAPGKIEQPALVGAADARRDASHVASIRYRDGVAATATGRMDEARGWIAVAAACLKPRRRADYAGGASRRGSRSMAETAFRAAARSMRPEHRTRGATVRQWSDLLGSNHLAAHEEDWCGREDSNLHGFTRCHLKAVRLPIPPRPHGEEDKGQARCPAKTALV